ncbi:MAG: hypothetical protein J0H59_13760 [Comamonadaceae bacterium]|nr:hypothetical protein [Comamonadaceae bacterium]
MDYHEFVDASQVNFSVNDRLIECGSTTWQIRNIAATSIGRKVVPFTVPEPQFNTPEPEMQLNVKAMAMAAAAAWLVVRFYFGMPKLAIAAALAAVGLFFFFALQALAPQKSAWNAEKHKTAEHWKVWDTMRRNPLVLFSLMLETNAGSKPLFYSLDESQITRANEAIKRSIAQKEVGDVNFQIETVNVGGEEAINNFGSSIYNQSIVGK